MSQRAQRVAQLAVGRWHCSQHVTEPFLTSAYCYIEDTDSSLLIFPGLPLETPMLSLKQNCVLQFRHKGQLPLDTLLHLLWASELPLCQVTEAGPALGRAFVK